MERLIRPAAPTLALVAPAEARTSHPRFGPEPLLAEGSGHAVACDLGAPG